MGASSAGQSKVYKSSKQTTPALNIETAIHSSSTVPAPETQTLAKLIMNPRAKPFGSNAIVCFDHVATENDKLVSQNEYQLAKKRRVEDYAIGLPTVGVNLNTYESAYNDLVKATIAEALGQVGVPKVQGVDKWVAAAEGGLMENKRAASHLLFSGICLTDDDMPSLLNRVGNSEMYIQPNGTVVMNPKYWYNQLHQSNSKTRMELAAWIPTWLLTEVDKTAHNSAVDVMSMPGGIGLGGEYFKLVLWDKYAYVFKMMMESPVCQEARKNGFYPLFLLKQCINQDKRMNGTPNLTLAPRDGDRSKLGMMSPLQHTMQC
jgi:hypothetical protein